MSIIPLMIETSLDIFAPFLHSKYTIDVENTELCLIHSYSRYFLSIYQVLGSGEKALNKTDTFPVSWGLYSDGEDI